MSNKLAIDCVVTVFNLSESLVSKTTTLSSLATVAVSRLNVFGISFILPTPVILTEALLACGLKRIPTFWIKSVAPVGLVSVKAPAVVGETYNVSPAVKLAAIP